MYNGMPNLLFFIFLTKFTEGEGEGEVGVLAPSTGIAEVAKR